MDADDRVFFYLVDETVLIVDLYVTYLLSLPKALKAAGVVLDLHDRVVIDLESHQENFNLLKIFETFWKEKFLIRQGNF
jgi:hypothetical protein